MEENINLAIIPDENIADRTNNQISGASNLEKTPLSPKESAENRPQNPKFKTYENLEKAYDELQSEFTRKSQELAELKKNSADKAEDTPAYLKEDWANNVSSFFEEYEFAKDYKNEISKILVEDEKIKYSKNPLSKALLKILSQRAFTPQKMLEDEKFLNEYIYSNQNIKDKIISDYVEQLSSKSTPPLITKSFGSSLASTSSKPKTLKEIKELVEKMFH